VGKARAAVLADVASLSRGHGIDDVVAAVVAFVAMHNSPEEARRAFLRPLVERYGLDAVCGALGLGLWEPGRGAATYPAGELCSCGRPFPTRCREHCRCTIDDNGAPDGE